MNYVEKILANTIEANIKLFNTFKPKFDIEPNDAMNQYHIEGHAIYDKTKRPDKQIQVDTGARDADGNPILASKTIEMTRIAMSFQDLIVERRVGFLTGNPARTEMIVTDAKQREDEKNKRMGAMIDAIQQDNKMEYLNKEIARRLMSEMEVAELWYWVENQKNMGAAKAPAYTLKVRILSREQVDDLYPLYDQTGDMVAFARGYKTIDDQGKEFEHFDIFLPDIEYYYIKTQEGWILDPELLSPKLKVSGVVNNEVGKIMIIYYSQKKPEWHKVQPMCERLETSVSNHGEINEYFGAPILTLRGRMIGQTDKGEVGKIIELDGPDAEAKFLALNSQPESIKMEEENLEKWIYTLSQTPNITFDAMKAIGDVSGVSLELMFMDAHMAAKNKEEIFGKGLQRRINLLKTAIGKVMDTSLSPLIDSLNFKPVITPYMPKNKAEMIEMLSVAVTSNIMSVDTSVDVNDLIMDKEAEKEKLADEKAQNDQADLSMQSELAKLKTGPLSKTPSKPLAK